MDSIKQISRMTITTTGDASGIMSTPYGSFQVLRVKNDIVSEDSVYNWSSDGWVFNSFDINNYSNYRWYTNDFYEVGLYQFEEGKGNSMTFFKSETVVGIQTNTISRQAKIYPNPAHNLVYIDIETIPDRIEILDLTGRVKQISGPATTVDISSLAPGMYLLRVCAKDEILSSMLVKQ